MIDPKLPQMESEGDQILKLPGLDNVAVRTRSVTVADIGTLI
jgi:hypothetical protein